MKNLENLGLVELNAQEVLSIEGGNSGWGKWIFIEIVENWEDIKKGLKDGWNAGNK